MALTSCSEKCTITCSMGVFAAMIQLAPGLSVSYFVDIPAVFSFTGNGRIIRCGEIRTILTPDFAAVTSTGFPEPKSTMPPLTAIPASIQTIPGSVG